jgi:hypothetical protein
MTQLIYMQQLFGGGISLLSVAYLVVLFTACLFRSQQIKSPRLFRWACTLFALSVVAGPLVNLFVGWTAMTGNISAAGTSDVELTFLISNSVGLILLALSLICAFASMAPQQVFKSTEPAKPAKHPLD